MSETYRVDEVEVGSVEATELMLNRWVWVRNGKRRCYYDKRGDCFYSAQGFNSVNNCVALFGLPRPRSAAAIFERHPRAKKVDTVTWQPGKPLIITIEDDGITRTALNTLAMQTKREYLTRSYSKWELIRWCLPYGIWRCGGGREVLFDRTYTPICQRYPGQPTTMADPNERIPWEKQGWVYNDGAREKDKLRAALAILED